MKTKVDDDIAFADHGSEIVSQIDLANNLQLREARRTSDECLAHAAFGAGDDYLCHSRIVSARRLDEDGAAEPRSTSNRRLACSGMQPSVDTAGGPDRR